MEKTYTHLFECEYPQIDELIWKKHPDYEVEVSNYCHFRNIGKENDFRNYTLRSIPGLAYEVFNDVKLPAYSGVVPSNRNPYDLRVSNLIIRDYKDKERVARDKAFVKETVAQMISKEPFISQFQDPIEYFTVLGIPTNIMKAWKKSKLSKPKKV